MLNTYTTSTQTLDTDALLVFDENSITRGCATLHTPGSTTISVTVPGYYFVTFNAVAAATETETDDIDYVSFHLYNNGVAVPAAKTTADISDEDVKGTYSFSTLIRVLPSCRAIENDANLTVRNVGLASEVSSVNLAVVKL